MASTNITTFPGKVGISNTNPTHTLSIGSNVFVDDTGLIVTGCITTTGELSGDGAGLSNIQTSNVIGLTNNVARIGTLETDLDSNVTRIETLETDLDSNATRIGTLETDLDSNVTRIETLETDLDSNVTRIETLETDLDSNATRIGTLETDLDSNVTRIETLETDLDSNATRIGTLETDLDSNVTRIETLETDLDSNVTRIGNLESGDITITGTKTFQDDVVLESNLRVQGDLLVANTVNMTVSDPILELGSNNLNTGDVGLVMTRHGDSNSNVAIFFDETADILKLGYTPNGANDTTLEFDSNALAVSVQGALYGEIAGSNTITASTIYGEIAGSNAITASTGTFSGDFEVGTANLFVDTTTSNVGVGTNTPAYKLDVHGTANVGTLNATLMYSNASANIVAWNTSTNEVIDSGLERGFTEHPVEAMTDYKTYVEGHGTYEASASSEYVSGSDQRLAWKAMNLQTGDYTNSWRGIGVYNTSSPYVYDTAAAYNISNPKFITDVGGTRYNGDYIILKVPRSILLSHTVIYETTSESTRAPTGGTILGSSDGKNWFKLTTFSSISYTNGQSTVSVNATTPYTYFALVVTNIGGSTVVSLSEWRLFAEKPVTRMENVHISGELSSETLQTGYIKWPKVPLKAAESEGYVVTASSEFTTDTYAAWHAFEDKDEYNAIAETPAWAPAIDTFRNALADISRTTGEDTFNHEWIQIKLPQSIKLAYFLISRRDETPNFYEDDAVKSGRMYGSTDGITWSKLATFSNLSYTPYYKPRVDVQSTESYNYYRLTVTEAIGPTPVANSVAINELQLFEAATGVGAAPTSAKLQVAGSLGMAKGAEFFAGDDVVMELPKHDRPLTKYPEVASTTVSSSSDTQSGTAFNLNYSDIGWHPDNNYTSGTGVADGTTTTTDVNGTEYDGEWTQVLLPVAVKVKYLNVYYRTGYAPHRQTRDGTLLGSNDGTHWEHLQSWDDLSGTTSTSIPHYLQVVNNAKYFKYIRYIVERVTPDRNGDYLLDLFPNIAEIEIWGYEEGDTSVDVVHRSIPNKPGQQQLEVYWDANDSNSYSFANSTKAYDLSGSGVTGTITGNNGFDAEYNAWEFDGSGDYISGTLNTTTGAWVHSFSFWMNADTTGGSGAGHFVTLGAEADDSTSTIRFAGQNKFQWYFWGNDLRFDAPGTIGQWVHIVGTYDGGNDSGVSVGNFGVSRKIFINTEEGTVIENVSGSAGSDPLNLTTTSTPFRIGTQLSGGGGFDGKIANVRVFSKKLSIEQIRELYEYDAPRFGHRQNLVALHKGCLGVGVAHPTSRFEVAGADGLQEYPPKAMTDFETYMEGHGVFRASASTFASSSYQTHYAFDYNTSTAWLSLPVYDGTDGSYLGSVVTGNVDGSGTLTGEWIQIELPHKTFISRSTWLPNTITRGPKTGSIIGSNDGSTWYTITSFSGKTYASSVETELLNATASTAYKYFRIVGTTIDSGARLEGKSWRLFGTPAPSSLEDGHLTLGKALTLPRVSGHPAGAETPRAESLVVHYDTTVDSVVSGSTVVDISGTGNNGTLNGAAYSSTDPALTFDGVNDYVSGSIPSS